jgi:phosphomannomutase/phosphoglucomutase
MREVDALFTGEMSGHMFFRDEYYGFDDALYAAARLLRLLSNTDKTLDQMLAEVPKYHSTPEVRVTCPDEEKFEVVSRVTQDFAEDAEVITVDGVRVLFQDGWGLVRASNTQPALVLRAESKTLGGLSEIKRVMEGRLRRYPAVGDIIWD